MLTRYLVAMQDRLRLSDPEFAREVGLDEATWQALRSGLAGYTPAILARLLLHVPNAHALALEELHMQEESGALRLLDSALATAPAQPANTPETVPALAYAA